MCESEQKQANRENAARSDRQQTEALEAREHAYRQIKFNTALHIKLRETRGEVASTYESAMAALNRIRQLRK